MAAGGPPGALLTALPRARDPPERRRRGEPPQAASWVSHPLCTLVLMENQLVLITEEPAGTGPSPATRRKSGARTSRHGRPTRGDRTHTAAARAREALQEASRRAVDRERARRDAREAALLAAAAQPRLPHSEVPRRSGTPSDSRRPAA